MTKQAARNVYTSEAGRKKTMSINRIRASRAAAASLHSSNFGNPTSAQSVTLASALRPFAQSRAANGLPVLRTPKPEFFQQLKLRNELDEVKRDQARNSIQFVPYQQERGDFGHLIVQPANPDEDNDPKDLPSLSLHQQIQAVAKSKRFNALGQSTEHIVRNTKMNALLKKFNETKLSKRTAVKYVDTTLGGLVSHSPEPKKGLGCTQELNYIDLDTFESHLFDGKRTTKPDFNTQRDQERPPNNAPRLFLHLPSSQTKVKTKQQSDIRVISPPTIKRSDVNSFIYPRQVDIVRIQNRANLRKAMIYHQSQDSKHALNKLRQIPKVVMNRFRSDYSNV